jgi:serine/threonine protein kinase
MEDSSKTTAIHVAPNSSAQDELVGTTIDLRYEIVNKLGGGGIGEVYLARDLKLHEKPVVVKVLLEKLLQDNWVLQKFQQEKEALARVDHPGVVGILDTGELRSGKPYIVMQYVDGMSLRDAVRAKPRGMELERAASIIKQIGAALGAVHEKKIFHRDLKPENIMLQKLARGDDHVKIVDFGIAKVRESIVAPSTITGAFTPGTILYMSPEQLHGDRITAASDIYSFGVIAYEMVTGRRPFNPETIAHLSDMQREGIRVKPADLRPRLPYEAQTTILKALAFDPAGRPKNAVEFGEALAQALLNKEEPLKQYAGEPEKTPSTLVWTKPPVPDPHLDRQSAKTLVAPHETVSPHTQVEPVPVASVTAKRRWPKLAAGLLIAVAILIAGFTILIGGYLVIVKRQSLFAFGSKTNAGGEASQRWLLYSLTVQKMRDGRPYQTPFESSGQDIFETGYKFRLNVSTPQAGYLYVFNEGAPKKESTTITIIYPTPATNHGAANLKANEIVKTNWNTFAGQPGTEQFWVVWSASPIVQLEAARDAAFTGKDGTLTDTAMIGDLKDFLIQHSDQKLETTKDTTKQQTLVRATGDLIVKLVELEHR